MKVRFLTFDTYRLGASKHLELYANIFKQPFHLINSEEDLRAVIKSLKEDEIVLIDTAGESINKEIKLSEVNKLLEVIPEKVNKILTIGANSKTADLLKIKDKFKSIKYDYYIITKFDETLTIGPIVDLLYKDTIPVVYFTVGQSVPEDIKKADLEDIISFLF